MGRRRVYKAEPNFLQTNPEYLRLYNELQKEMMDNAIIETKKDISEIKKSIDKMEERLFNQSRQR